MTVASPGADKIVARRNRAASPRHYRDGYVPGCRSASITPTSQDESTTVP